MELYHLLHGETCIITTVRRNTVCHQGQKVTVLYGVLGQTLN